MANITFGQRLRRGRIRNAWTQTDLAKKLGVTAASISNWETGKILLSKDQKVRLREVLGLDSSDSGSGVEAPATEQSGPSAFCIRQLAE